MKSYFIIKSSRMLPYLKDKLAENCQDFSRLQKNQPDD
jgi:hypothetical protein